MQLEAGNIINRSGTELVRCVSAANEGELGWLEFSSAIQMLKIFLR